VDSVTDERREHSKAEAERREPMLDCVPAAWLAAIDKRVAAALDAYERVAIESIGQIVSEERAAVRKQVEALRLGLDGLRHELAEMRGVADGDVVDLPSPLIRKVRGAA
jgi:hypothetical protein